MISSGLTISGSSGRGEPSSSLRRRAEFSAANRPVPVAERLRDRVPTVENRHVDFGRRAAGLTLSAARLPVRALEPGLAGMEGALAHVVLSRLFENRPIAQGGRVHDSCLSSHDIHRALRLTPAMRLTITAPRSAQPLVRRTRRPRRDAFGLVFRGNVPSGKGGGL